MATTVTSQIQGITINEALKAPVALVFSTNITLSGLQGGGTEGTRSLVKGQTNTVENGIYNQSSGSWVRAKDFDGNRDVVKGTLVIDQSNTNVLYRVTTADPIIIGTSAITFEAVGTTLTQADIGTLLYPITAAEISAGVTPTNYAYEAGDLRRYGAIGGTSTNASAVQAALNSNSIVRVKAHPSGNYGVASTVTVPAGVTVIFEGGVIDQTSGTFTFPNHSKMYGPETVQCFTPASSVTFGYDVVGRIYAAWWGFGHANTATNNKLALVAAMNAQSRGGTIMLPNTGCSVNGDIVPPFNGIELLGQGWISGYNDTTAPGTTLTVSTGTRFLDLRAHFLTANPNEYFMTKGIRIDGNSIVDYGLDIEGTKYVVGCLVTGCKVAGIFLRDNINQAVVEDTTCISNRADIGGVGLLVAGNATTKFVVSRSNFRLNYRGMEIRSGLNFTLDDCVFESNVERGLLERNSDGANLAYGLHRQLWFENNNSISATRSQFTLSTAATNPIFYPQGNRWEGGNLNGSSVAGQRSMDIGSNCLDTTFVGTRFAGEVADTSSILVAAGTRTVFEDCFNVSTFGSASAANYLLRENGKVPQTLTGAGAISLSTKVTLLVTTGANALTLADGAEGQEKKIVMKTDGGAGTLTPTNLYNGTTITFDDVGDSANLFFTDGQWVFMGGSATLA